MTPAQQKGGESGKFVSGAEHAELTVLVITYNSEADIARLIGDLRVAACDHTIRLIVVDNQSRDETVDIVRQNADITVVESGGNLGYAGGINVALPLVGSCENVLVLNPDLRIAPGAVSRLHAAAEPADIGAVVPLILDDNGVRYPSLCREPSITRMLGDALLGSRFRRRPAFSSEIDHRPSSYVDAHEVDWAMGAALLVPLTVVREVGEWNEDFFLYSEEVDYFRRIRDSGRRIRFEPSAVVRHRRGGSGRTPALATLMAVNRIRYIEIYHRRPYALLFRGAVAASQLLRSYNVEHRRTLAVVLHRRRWAELPKATKGIPPKLISGPSNRGSVIIPAFNEAAVIERTLEPLSRAALDGFIEVIVVCNGCTDDTGDVARRVPGVTVLELEQGSKPAALNAGDAAATLWPRLYLDADVRIDAESVIQVLDRLSRDDVLVARPGTHHDSDGSSFLVRSYFRVQRRIHARKEAMWSAGAYGLNQEGHARFGSFPNITNDDLFVDTRFDASEKAVVTAAQSARSAPTNVKSLLAVLRRHHRGGVELRGLESGPSTAVQDTSRETVAAVLRGVRGPRSAFDAGVYLSLALAKRRPDRRSQQWERDESSRIAI